jgi:hypothetical protein
MGNHEHYHGKFHKTYDELKRMMPDNVTMLEKEMFEYEGVVFLGGTLWTDLNKGDPMTVMVIRNMMNEYKCVQNFYPEKNLYYKLTPEHTVGEFRKTRDYFKMILEMTRDKPVVVITHMAPSFMSVNEKFANEGCSNGGYASDLSEFILDHPQIKLWTLGHTHHSHWYYVGDTLVVCNPRGYQTDGYVEHTGFQSNFVVDLDNMPDPTYVSDHYDGHP